MLGVPDARRTATEWGIAAVITLAVVAGVAYYDLGTNLPLGDEWMFRWAEQHLADGQGIHLWPGVLPVAMVQLLAAYPLAASHLEPRFWRLAVLPFLVLGGICTASLARQLRASPFWAGAGALAVFASPIALSVGAALTSDIAYLGLLMASALLAVRWVRDGRGAGWTLVLAVAATTERQQGLVIFPALAIGLLQARGAGGQTR